MTNPSVKPVAAEIKITFAMNIEEIPSELVAIDRVESFINEALPETRVIEVVDISGFITVSVRLVMFIVTAVVATVTVDKLITDAVVVVVVVFVVVVVVV